ncbi:MAG: LPP20 family lipoprotein [Planctomycetes bacterium]|nr:LPP20 family lipoprotein [Planctomycetota bacterium]
MLSNTLSTLLVACWWFIRMACAESPAWIKKPYGDQFPREQFFVGVGCVEIGKDRADARREAEELARANVAQQIRAHVTSTSEDQITAIIKGKKEEVLANFKQSVATRTSLEVFQCRTDEIYEDRRVGKNLLYVRAVLNRAEAAGTVRAKLDGQVADVEK